MVDIHHVRFLRALETEPNNKFYQRSYTKFLKYEKISSNKADLVIPISETEKDYMIGFCKAKNYKVISNIHYTKVLKSAIPSFNNRKDLLFIGSKHHPNIDAVYYLYKEILPLVWTINPDIKLNIIGNIKDEILDIEDDRIVFHGFVPDIDSFFLNNKLMVAPIRSGAGVKGKIGQSFEYHLPLVTSSTGAEGMNLENNYNALIADTPKDFADAILKLYTNENLWEKLSHNSEQSLFPFSIKHLEEQIFAIEQQYKK